MRAFLIAALAAALPSIAMAQEHGPSLPLQCAPFQAVMDGIKAKFQEKPAIVGAMGDEGSTGETMVLTVNPDTNSWTIVAHVEHEGHDVGCVVLGGVHLKPAGAEKTE